MEKIKKEVVIMNEEDNVIRVTLNTDRDYISLTGDVYQLQELDMENREEYIRDFINNVFTVEVFLESPSMSVDSYVELYRENEYAFIEEILGDVEDYYYKEGTLYYWQDVGGGQITLSYYEEMFDKDFKDLEEVWDKHHLKTDNLEQRVDEILEVLSKYEEEVDQELAF